MLIAVIILLILLLAGAVAGAVVWLNRQQAASADGPRLIADLGNGQLRPVPLDPRREVWIGREPGNQIVVANPIVSRQHARVFWDGAAWAVQDNNSANGTFVNRQPVGRRALQPGDDLEIGPARIRLVLPLAAEPPERRSMVGLAGPGAPAGERLSQQLFGPYAVVRSLGEGGIARVLLAQDTRDNRRLVALKLISEHDPFLMEKFQQEGSLRLVHPHIAQVLDTGQVAGRSYIAMEYVDGPSLRKLLGGAALPLPAALVVAGQLLEALEYAHAQGVIHRDIKPENIMISPREGVKVIDFGIARVLGAATRTRDGMLIGTPVYMSFEQANGDTVNPTSDLYAAAIVLYELLTGKVPFSAEDPTEVVLQHRRLQPLPPRQLNPDISPQVEAAILRALEKDVRRRHQTAQAFAAALGCAPGQPLPPDLSAAAARLALPVQNERGNAVNLPTRFPQAAVAATPRGHRLRVQSGTRRGQVIPLLHGACVGRSEIDPADGTISRQHLRVEAQSGACVVYDISSHGTAINGARLAPGTPCRLAPGAIVQVGQTVLVYEAAP